ncbi:imm11 family protein [Qipengyuania sp. NPDC077563]|uniref:imm11 family protein n=1 Tax=Qipengyuania sp. NPDC077563 TaxID=3364497 RepID=UPI00384CC221
MGWGKGMVYSLGAKGVYEFTPRSAILGNEQRGWDQLQYLEPEKVDRHAAARRRFVIGYGYAVDPDTAPHKVLWPDKRKPPPDYALGNNEIMLVSPRFRDLVERFEPDVHQFLPVRMLRHENDTEPFDTFYWFVCCNLLDTLDPDLTTLTWEGSYEERMECGLRRGFWHFDQTVKPEQKPVFSLKAIGDHHLWRDAYHVRNFVHCSDAFGEALLAAELTGFELWQYEQV